MTLSPTFSELLELLDLLLPLLHRQQDQEIEDAEDDRERQEAGQPGRLPCTRRREQDELERLVHSVSGSAGKGLMELQAEFFKRAEHYSLPNPPHGVKVKV